MPLSLFAGLLLPSVSSGLVGSRLCPPAFDRDVTLLAVLGIGSKVVTPESGGHHEGQDRDPSRSEQLLEELVHVIGSGAWRNGSVGATPPTVPQWPTSGLRVRQPETY